MNRATDRIRTIGEVIDELERIREELLNLQRTMERMEPPESASSDGDGDGDGARHGKAGGKSAEMKSREQKPIDGPNPSKKPPLERRRR